MTLYKLSMEIIFNLISFFIIKTNMAKIKRINKRFIQIQAQHLLSQMGYFYVAYASNQKKAKSLFQALPFFFFDNFSQSKLYDAINKNTINCHLDKADAFKKLCYSIYVDFSKSLHLYPVTIDEFYVHIEDKCYEEEVKYKYFKYNNLHTYLFFLMIFGIILLYFMLYKKNNK